MRLMQVWMVIAGSHVVAIDAEGNQICVGAEPIELRWVNPAQRQRLRSAHIGGDG
ncbi:hypothetical protein [Nocardia sp. NPDC003183]